MSTMLSLVRVSSATSTASGSLVVVGIGSFDSVERSEPSEIAGLGLLFLFVVLLPFLCLGIIKSNFNIQLKF